MFSVRLVSADSYQASPLTPYDVAFSEFRKSKIKNVPTIRVFGSTLSGKKVCLHIHGVFPYMYVPYVGGDSAEAFAHRLAEGLDSAINASLGSASAAAQHVYKIQEVKGVPFYGFHEKRHHFFKIYFYNPAIIKKAADLLQNGSVLSQTLQPHEAHIPFILQFMIDYNIYGMSLINLNDVKYRQINRRREYVRLNDENITPHFVTRNYLPPTVKRQSTCEIEVDAWASDIKNKDAIEKGLDVNPGLAAIWAEEKARRILDGFDGGDSQLGPSCSPPRSNLQPTDNDLLQIQRFQRKLVIISQSEETSVSMNSNSSYPVEVDDEFNLLDASHLERHIGPQYENQKQSNDKDKREQTKLYSDLVTLSRENLSLHLENERLENVHEEKSTVSKFEALQSSGKESCSQNQNGTLNKSIFEAEDISLVDILENLAEGHETNELVEEDSILGSHCSAVVSEYKSDEEDQDGISDLNLTTFEIDSLSLNCASTVCSGRPESAASDREKGATSFAIKSLSVEDSDDQNTIHSQSGSKNSSMIPQFDGTDDLPRKRSSSVERSALKKSRKAGNGNKDVLVKVEGNLNRVKGREKIYQSQVKGSNDYSELDNAKKEEFKIFDSSTSGTLESDLDRTLVPEGKEVVAFEGKSLISESSESADVSEYAGPDHTLMVVEKLICDYKSSKEVVRSARKEMIVNHKDYGIERRSIFLKDEERQLQSSSRVLKSPKRDLSSSTCDLMSPSRTLKCPSSSKQTPNKESRSSSRALKGPSYALRSPRRNYETLNITVTPSKKRKEFDKKLDGISKDDESSGDASLKEISVFTKKSTSKDEVFNVKSNRKPLLPDKETLVKSSEDVCACVSPNRKLVFSQKSETEESCKDVETPKKLLLSTKPQSRKHYKDVFWESVALDRKCMLSQKSRLGKSSEADEIYGKQLLSQKSQSSKSSKDDCSVNASTNRRIVFSQISQFKKCSEDKFSKVTKSKERLLSSQKSTVAKSLECDNFIKGIVHEILLTQKTALEKHSEDELNFLSYGKSSKTNSSESNLLEDINNISPQLEKNKVYDEETDSSDFEGNLEVFRKGLSSDSKSIKILPESGKLMKEMIEEEEHLGREKNPESGKMKVLDVNITEEINNQVCNTEDLLTVTFTEFANIHLNPRYKFTTKSILNLNLNPLVAITTKNFAPTRQNVVQNMHLYGIPTCRNQEPFYSDHNDIRAQKDITHQIINKKQVLDYPPFKSEIGSVVGIKLWRRMKVNEFQSSGAKLNSVDIKKGLAERRLRTITPLYLPPNTKKVVKWLKAKGHLKCKEEEKVQETKECVEKNKHGVENKSESSNLEDKAKLNSFVSSSVLEVSVNSEEKSRESLSKDSFLCSTLGPSELLISEKNKKKLGRVSFGQVDFSMDETKTQDDVANQNLQNAKAITTYQFLTILSLEVHVATRKDLLPDPQYDPIEALFYVIYNDFPPTSTVKRVQLGAIIVDLNESHNLRGLYPSCAITYATCEEDLFCNIVSLIGECNPDILIGWELETLSWGYVLQRAAHLGANLATSISRIPGSKCAWESQALDLEDLAEIKLPGRIVLDVWRIMRHEIALLSYTFENVMFHVMHQRLPCPSFKTLTEWWNSEVPCLRWRVLDFYTKKVLGILKLLDQLDIIGRTCEHARLFGIQFFEVFSRGSQFRVESMMLRLTKPFNYVLVSPSVRQRSSMRAPEALPLIMEPISTFYSDPVIVLDFQSLYPSIIIAYNYCFSTCLGRVEHMGQCDPFEFGCTTLKVTKKTAMKLQGKINFSPVGIGFVKPEVRKGILPRMLNEILNTRLMVKKSMKDHPKDDRPLQQVLHNRQLGLKLIANVTYGYTAANFSGRMACIEVADSIVSKGKETLERAIRLVEATSKWGASVVYGDTDSLFVLLHGKSRNDAFKIGAEIADAVTAANPTPVKLKFEKVLHPCILQTKKRYCGYSYETVESYKPEYLAKGIETVRRDGCPAAAKILEKSLKILFNTKDLSLVKQYVTRQLDKVFRGIVSIQDLTFAREFRGLRGYKKNACVPALELTRRLMKKDPRNIPRTSERVPYIIVAGAPNETLIRSVRSPSELLADQNLRPNAIYYITRVIIPPLNRCLNLLGADVHIWFRDMPHREVITRKVSLPNDKQKATTISQFFNALVCLSCGSSSENMICKQCVEQPSRTIVVLHQKLRSLEKNVFDVDVICRSCTGQLGVSDCESLDCPVTFCRSQVERDYVLVPTIRRIIDEW